ncbi:hypothetical protein MTR67_034590 [Solanum verrucosum]|uniref:Uncharacterized protein n=1 Tax=Solanum verrucosum TaxID=315347 RepID=A0AAF0U8J2_SOLVR|nr:hypothetical protein MTR67_034590 [Solanum verrucosum]
MTKQQIKKDQERDENMAKMMTQLDLLTKHVMGSSSKAVNTARGLCPTYPRSGGNQGWNRDHDDGWRDRDREWRDRCTNWRERDGVKERYVPPHECQKPKEPRVDLENFCTEDMLAHILTQMKGSNKRARHSSLDIARPKVASIDEPPRKRARGIVTNEGVDPP